MMTVQEAISCLEGVLCGAELLETDVDDITDLLREQEPVDAIRDSEAYGKGEFGVWWYACGNRHGVIDYKDPFCRHCGREVNWDAAD